MFFVNEKIKDKKVRKKREKNSQPRGEIKKKHKKSNKMTSIFELSERLLSPPSSPLVDDHHMNDQRALEKLAMELSMLDMGASSGASSSGSHSHNDDLSSALMNMPTDGIVPGSTLNAFTSMLGFNGVHFDDRKKSQNMTECVPVPSSEHVAEIVGRQGE